MRRHRTDLVALVGGLLFAGLAIVVLLAGVDALEDKWLAPVVLIGVGVVGLVATARSRTSTPPG